MQHTRTPPRTKRFYSLMPKKSPWQHKVTPSTGWGYYQKVKFECGNYSCNNSKINTHICTIKYVLINLLWVKLEVCHFVISSSLCFSGEASDATFLPLGFSFACVQFLPVFIHFYIHFCKFEVKKASGEQSVSFWLINWKSVCSKWYSASLTSREQLNVSSLMKKFCDNASIHHEYDTLLINHILNSSEGSLMFLAIGQDIQTDWLWKPDFEWVL